MIYALENLNLRPPPRSSQHDELLAIRHRVLTHMRRTTLAEHPKVAEMLEAALKGEVSGQDLVEHTPLELRGLIVFMLYKCLAPQDVLRSALRLAWLLGHKHVERAASLGGDCLVSMFRAAAFPVPDSLPETLTVWRGVWGINRETAEQGLSWTTNRGYAAYWGVSLGRRRPSGELLVLRATAPRSSVIFHWERYEGGANEVMFDHRPVTHIDGPESELRAEAEQWRLAYEPTETAVPQHILHAHFDQAFYGPAALARAVLGQYQLPLQGVHGPAHWLRVSANGRALVALTPGADPEVVDTFAMLHDSRRVNEGADPQHGQRAAEYVAQLAQAGFVRLSDAQLKTLMAACSRHELGEVSDDLTIGVCWDADRLDLSRLHRPPIDNLLSTRAALDPTIRAAAWAAGVGGEVDAAVAAEWGLAPDDLA